jgi:hypothetical protein
MLVDVVIMPAVPPGRPAPAPAPPLLAFIVFIVAGVAIPAVGVAPAGV